ncbi:MAG: class I SAM-dependent methyltransferase [Candidatus Omnitrophica bacterium]|nr:class I SAM-dependent methyltransferase [Candidatus Omnitrophota bacterium]
MQEKGFVCPECKSELLMQDGLYTCRNCASEWRVKDGIPCFLKGDVPYWCELSAEEAVDLNRIAETKGWRKAAESCFTEKLQQFVMDENRINWKYFINSDTEGRILDAGSGWGTIAFALSEQCCSVYAFESVWERARFIRIRKEQDKVINLYPVCGNILKLPFPDNYFDVVILNGVLEWLGMSDRTYSPDKVQEAALRNIFRVLKPGGTLYIGIENALAYFYFFGKRDPHSGLRFATLMPRWMANIYSKLVKKREYSTYIYSLRGYRKILNNSGFKDINFYVPVPGYLKFKYLVPLEPFYIFRYWIDSILYEKLLFSPVLLRKFVFFVRLLLRCPFLRFSRNFVPDFGIIACKGNSI